MCMDFRATIWFQKYSYCIYGAFLFIYFWLGGQGICKSRFWSLKSNNWQTRRPTEIKFIRNIFKKPSEIIIFQILSRSVIQVTEKSIFDRHKKDLTRIRCKIFYVGTHFSEFLPEKFHLWVSIQENLLLSHKHCDRILECYLWNHIHAHCIASSRCKPNIKVISSQHAFDLFQTCEGTCRIEAVLN